LTPFAAHSPLWNTSNATPTLLSRILFCPLMLTNFCHTPVTIAAAFGRLPAKVKQTAIDFPACWGEYQLQSTF
jgi:hypothetical protein